MLLYAYIITLFFSLVFYIFFLIWCCIRRCGPTHLTLMTPYAYTVELTGQYVLCNVILSTNITRSENETLLLFGTTIILL